MLLNFTKTCTLGNLSFMEDDMESHRLILLTMKTTKTKINDNSLSLERSKAITERKKTT